MRRGFFLVCVVLSSLLCGVMLYLRERSTIAADHVEFPTGPFQVKADTYPGAVSVELKIGRRPWDVCRWITGSPAHGRFADPGCQLACVTESAPATAEGLGPRYCVYASGPLLVPALLLLVLPGVEALRRPVARASVSPRGV